MIDFLGDTKEELMLLHQEITTSIKIESLKDLKKIKELEKTSNLKINRSEVARKLKVDRRTVSKYIQGFEKKTKRRKGSQFDKYYETIKQCLEDSNKVFAYKRVLWQYMKDNYGMPGAASTFRHYIQSKEELSRYFRKTTSTANKPVIRFETEPGHQAQIDWKESIPLRLKNGEKIELNIFVMILSYSRFRYYTCSLSKTREVLFHIMTQQFETLGGVPREILVDNMKAIMDEARTPYKSGKISNEFQQFANDYGFKIKPCLAGRPETKAKVESPMRILEEIKAYSGDCTLEELFKKVAEINNRENASFHQAYQMIPQLGLEKEKDFLMPLPTEQIRNQYLIKTTPVKANASAMISYKSNLYSVPPEYMNKNLKIQVYDDQIHAYYNTKLVTIHRVSTKKLNYQDDHYIEIAKKGHYHLKTQS